MSLVHLRRGVHLGAILCGLAGIALASIHFSGDGFSEDVIAAMVIGLLLVAAVWVTIEAIYTLNAEAKARHDQLHEDLTNAEAIGAWALNAASHRYEGDGAVVGINGLRRR